MKFYIGTKVRDHEGRSTFTMDGMNREEAATVYFALRAYRDSLHKSLIEALTKDIDQEDYEISTAESFMIVAEDDWEGSLKEYFDAENVMPYITSKVPQVTLGAIMNPCEEYEELAFLHDQLGKVNAVLFEMMDNHDSQTKTAIRRRLDV